MDGFYWLVESEVAGSSRPRSDVDLQPWRNSGVRAVVSLVEEQLDFHGFEALHLPVPDGAAPSLEQLIQACHFIDDQLSGHRPVVVHCLAGKGRTGTVLAAWLVSHGATAAEAIRRVRQVAPGGIETVEQEQVLVAFSKKAPESVIDSSRGSLFEPETTRAAMSDLDLMRLRADTDFVYDTRGRMIAVNDPDRGRPPHLFLGGTSEGCVARFGATISNAMASQLKTIIDSEPSAIDFDSRPTMLDMIRETLAKEVPLSAEGGGPAYRFAPTISRPRDVVQLTASNLDLVRDTYPWLRDELPEWAPCFAVVREGHAVSVCFSSRIGHEAAEAGLDTRPDFRGRGFAVAVTAAWGAAIVESGRVPIYSTSYDNLASQGVARRVGLIRFGVDITFS